MKFNRLFLDFALCSAVASGVVAAPLTPEQALNFARGNTVATGQLRAKADDMKLVYTLDGRQGPTLYVFTPAAADAKGFIIAAADDQVTPLLGYSDDCNFDPSNIPPQMLWLLTSYSRDIDYIVANPGNASKMKLAVRHPEPAGSRRFVQRNATHSAISPLCATMWNQSTPYNNECPVVNGSRSVTGCVATAMAQVMKYHKWPTTGTGTHTYQWTPYENGSTYSDTFNFGATTFNWSSMLNTYGSSATSTQKSAVAKLMHACGNAAEMNYTPNESGAYDLVAAKGMIDYMRYDAAMTVQLRNWYTASEWDDLVYGELAAGRPVMYCGQSSGGGHAFVCDGCDTSGRYHINWGWGGTADGYFLLADLNPYEQGIGGSSSNDGFNSDQSALIGCKKAETGSTRPIVMACSDFTTDKSSYNVNSSTWIKFSSDEYFTNRSTFDLSGIHIGIGLTNGSQSSFIDGTEAVDLQQYYGYMYFGIYTQSFPVGSWKAYPAYSTDGVNWQPMKYDKSKTNGYLLMNVTSSTITISEPTGTEEPDPNPGDPTPATSISVNMAPASNYNNYYRGNQYSFTGSFTSDGYFSNDYHLILVNETDTKVAATGDVCTVAATEAGTVNQRFNITLPGDLDLSKTYYVALCTLADNTYSIRAYYDLTVEANPNEDNSAKSIDITLESTSANGDYYRGKSYDLTYKFEADGYFSNRYYLVLVKVDGNTLSVGGYGDDKVISLSKAGAITDQFSIEIPQDLDLTKSYYLSICTLSGNTFSILTRTDINVCDEPDPFEAKYYRPAGCFYVTFSTDDSNNGSVSAFDVPYIAVDPYSTVAFKNASFGATSYNWSYYSDVTGSVQNYTSSSEDLEFEMLASKNCIVPELAAKSGNATSIFQLKGAARKDNNPTALHLMAAPNYPDVFDVNFNKHCWSSSKYFSLNTDRAGVQDGGTSTWGFANDLGQLLGRNTTAQDFNGLATAFEAPRNPYLVRALGVLVRNLALSGSTSPDFTMSIYRLNEIPAYQEEESVEIVPGELIASKTISITPSYLSENLSLNSGTSTYYGVMRFPLDELAAIDGPVLVTFTGYNVEAVKSGFTALCSADYYDEGYGEIGYIHMGSTDKWLGFNNLFSNLAGCKTAPSVLMEVERTFFNMENEEGETNLIFDAIGESKSVTFHSSRGMENIAVTAPAWVGVSMTQSLNADNTYTIVATMTSRKVENSQAPRRAGSLVNGKVTFNLNNTRTKEIGVNIEEELLTGIFGITDSREIERVIYVNMNGQVSSTPFDGVNIVIYRFTDGTKSTSKLIK